MRAVVIRQFGDPKLLKVEEVPTPQPPDGQALVEVQAAAINPSDVKNVQGVMHGTTLPRVPGRDFAGVVVRGPAYLLGREVFGTGGDIGFTRDGSHAQFLLLPLSALTPKPTNLPMDEAGSAGLIFVTAFSALISAARLAEGETALIIGATGGVGSAAVQIAASRRAKIIGAVRSESESPIARQNGAHEIIVTASANLPDAVTTLTHARGADVIFDTTGRLFAESIDSAALHARLCVISAPPDGQSTFSLRNLYRKELTVHGTDTRHLDAVACAKLLAQMLPAFQSRQFKVTPGQPRPLTDAPAAYAQSAAAHAHFYLQPQK